MSSTEDYLDSLLANAKKNSKTQSGNKRNAESTLSDLRAESAAHASKSMSEEAELDALLRGDSKPVSDIKEDSSFSVQSQKTVISEAPEPEGERRMTTEEIDALLASVDLDEQLGIDESIEDPVEKILSISEDHIADDESTNMIDGGVNSLLDEMKQFESENIDISEEPNIVEVSEQLLEQVESEKEIQTDDMNRVMSPDEIAAIIAQAGQDMQETADLMEDPAEEIIGEAIEEVIEETIEETIEEPAVEMDDPNKMMSPEDIEALLASMGTDEPAAEEIEEAAEEVIEEAIEETIEESIEEAAAEMDDPNKMMSPEDIEALLASMGADEPAAEEIEEAAEEVIEETIEETIEEAAVEMDDPNKMMSPEDIEALLASMGADEPAAEEIEEAAEEVIEEAIEETIEETIEESIEEAAAEMDDPNKMMSPEDIEALLASMGADEPAAEEIEEAAEEVIEETIEETIEEPAVEMDDPNKMMSPEDIEALLASMGTDEPAQEEIEEAIEEVEQEEYERTLTLENGEEVSLDTPIGVLLGEDMDDEEDVAESVDESVENINGLDGLGDFSEEDIEKMLNQASDISDVNEGVADEATDITDLLSELGTEDEDIGDIADTLKASDENVLLDNSLMDKLDKAEEAADNEDAEDDAEESAKKKKKKKKGGFLSKLFGKKEDDSESDDEDASEEPEKKSKKAKKANKAVEPSGSDDEQIDTSVFEDILNDKPADNTEQDVSDSSDSEADKEADKKSDNTSEDSVSLQKADDMPANNAASEDSEADDDDDEEEEESSKKGKKKKKKGKKDKEKKPGLIARILSLLTEEVEDDEPAEASQLQLSDENAQILAEVDAEEDPKAKKKKKKEEEKAKKAEKKAAKKAEAEKKKKKKEAAKKEKAQEGKDEGKKIPKKHVMASVIFAASVFLAIYLIGTNVPKLLTLSDARKAFYSADYNEAFLKMYGKKLNESDQLLYDKAKVVILLQRKYESYENYSSMNMPKEALNSLLLGLEKYDEIIESGKTLGMEKELDAIKDKILAALYDNYGVTEAEAKETLTYGAIDYTRKLDSILNGTPFNRLTDEINVKYGFVDDSHLNDPEAFYQEYPDMLPEEKEYIDSQQSDLYEQLLDEGISE